MQPFINSPYLPPFPPPQRNTELYQNLMVCKKPAPTIGVPGNTP